MQRENQQTSNGRCCEFKDGSRLLTFAPLAVVEPAEGLVLGDVGVEELERVLRDDAVRDDFVVSYDVDKGQRAQPVFGVGLHRVELDFSCWAAWRLATLQTLGTAGGGSPLSLCSTQVKVIPPRWLSLKRSRKVPGSLSFSRLRSISLLTKPMM